MPDLKVILDLKRQNNASQLVEQLRYAGIVGSVTHNYRDDEDADGVLTFRLYCPPKVRASVWADQNHKRMASFGIRTEIID